MILQVTLLVLPALLVSCFGMQMSEEQGVISLLNRKFAHVEKELETLRSDRDSKLKDIESKLKASIMKTERLEEKLENTEKIVTDLKRENSKMRQLIKRLVLQKQIIQSLKQKNVSEPATINKNEIKPKRNAESRIIASKSRKARLLLDGHQTVPGPKIGFFATTADQQTNLTIGQVIHFPNVITNVGQSFDANTAIFKAPVSGLYQISTTILNYSGHEIRCEFVKNGTRISLLLAGDKTSYSPSSSSIVLQLSVNDEVWLRVTQINHVHVFGEHWSTLSGFLIAEM